MVSVSIPSTVLNRLIAARHLIDNSGPELSVVSEPLAVAQKILVTHDSAELVLLALLSKLEKKANEQSFMANVRAAVGKAFEGDSALIGNIALLFDQMNRVRVEFKHHGLLPDSRSTYHLCAEVITVVDELCDRFFQTPLLSIDHSAAIHLEEISSRFVEARLLIDKGEYKGALEAVAKGLYRAFWDLDTSPGIVGQASSETALLLSGRGIDPASFLTMQKLLPAVHGFDAEVLWALRGTGHEGNWTRENAEFCLRTATSTVVRLQSAPSLPRPIDFYDQFEDVVEITADYAVVSIEEMQWISGGPTDKKIFDRLRKGDRVVGQAIGRFVTDLDFGDKPGDDLEHATYIAVRYPRHPSLPLPSNDYFSHLVLWFQRDDIKLSYQTSERYLEIQRMRLENE